MKITKQTIVRTILMLVVAINLALKAFGKPIIDIEEGTVESFVEYAIELAILITGFWKNNSFTSSAIKADEYLRSLKSNDVSELGGDSYSFDNWVKTFKGKKLDPDKQFGVQCVDLIKHYCRNVLEIEKSFFDTWGNAIQWYENYGKSGNWKYLEQNFTMIKYKKGIKIQKGDIAVFKSKSQYGHIAVCNGIFDSNSFEAYDQNYNGTGAGMTKRTFEYEGKRTLMCLLRPKNQKNINPKPIYKKTTANLHAYKSSSCTTISTTIPAGTKVELINDNAGKFTKKGVTYGKAIIKYKNELYYVAKKYLK